tara:strand:- start:239723 stop:239962 length:240 start_codon:yes stop_codon:yes gene_type:complete
MIPSKLRALSKEPCIDTNATNLVSPFINLPPNFKLSFNPIDCSDMATKVEHMELPVEDTIGKFIRLRNQILLEKFKKNY